jgi:GMC oxidoreductase/FAD binding domain
MRRPGRPRQYSSWKPPRLLLDANLMDDVPGDLSSDLVIVGAGTVGLYLAAALTDAKVRSDVILLETGPKVASTSLNSVTSMSIGKPHKGVHLGRASGLGGTSSLWGGQLAEFSEADLERDDAIWPFSYEELQKYYRIVYQRLAVGSPASTAFYQQKFGGETEESRSVERFFTYWLKEPNFATLNKRLIKSDPSIRVVVNLTANGFEFEGENARSLICTSADGRNVRIRAQRFIFASGTIATSRFFLSTQRHGNVPWASNDNIGLYFQDHLGGKIAKGSVLNEKRFRDYFENGWVNGVKLQPKLTLSRTRRQSLLSGACGFFTFDSSVSENVANLKRTIRGLRSGLSFSSATSFVTDVVSVGRSMLPIVSRYVQSRRIFALFDQGLTFHVQAEQIPIASSRIRLLDSDPAADGLIPVAVDWKCDGRELAAIYDLAAGSDAYLRSRGLAQLTMDPALQRRDSSFIDRLGDTNHQCGGMRMSASPGTGVVDGNGRVWGTSNVWVAGPAVFPSSSHANCTLTGLAIAARLLARLQ